MTDIEELAKRAVACKAWRWMPGMRLGGMPRDAVPDLGDPATLGCLMHLVQQAGGDLPAHPDAESLVAALEACDG